MWQFVSDALKLLSMVWLLAGVAAIIWTYRTYSYFAGSGLIVVLAGELIGAMVGSVILAFCGYVLDALYDETPSRRST
jgi:hypothetical protein